MMHHDATYLKVSVDTSSACLNCEASVSKEITEENESVEGGKCRKTAKERSSTSR